MALAARGSHPGGHGRVSQRHVPDQVNNDLFTIIVILYSGGVIALVVGFILYRSKWQPVKSHWLRTQIVQLVVFSLLAFIGYHLFASKGFKRAFEHAKKAQVQNARGNPQPTKPRSTAPKNPGQTARSGPTTSGMSTPGNGLPFRSVYCFPVGVANPAPAVLDSRAGDPNSGG